MNASRAAKKDWKCSRCASRERTVDPCKRLLRNMNQYVRRHPDVVPPAEGLTRAYVMRVLETYGMPEAAMGDLSLCAIVFDEHSNPEVILSSETASYVAKRRKKMKNE